MSEQDIARELQQQVEESAQAGSALSIPGGNTKSFLGRACPGKDLDVSGHRGILSYEPTELVITARGGTPLAELESTLAERGQMLPFEPPRFGPAGTIGGALASGLAGPRRPWGGAPRDLLLGVKILDGRGHILEFGGQVMKNVAGYDLSRLMAGALGTLGILLEVSVKVLPRPAREVTLITETDAAASIESMQQLQGSPLPLTGAAYLEGRLHLRLAGNAELTGAIARQVGATVREDDDFWASLRDQKLDFFAGDDAPLWRLSLAPAARTELDERSLIDWGGAQRWLRGDLEPQEIRDIAARHGGHATLFRGGDRDSERFHPLPPAEERLHRSLKAVFDPHGILNPGRLYPGW
jgi:glycolate oxidase FAD binding subunit